MKVIFLCGYPHSGKTRIKLDLKSDGFLKNKFLEKGILTDFYSLLQIKDKCFSNVDIDNYLNFNTFKFNEHIRLSNEYIIPKIYPKALFKLLDEKELLGSWNKIFKDSAIDKIFLSLEMMHIPGIFNRNYNLDDCEFCILVRDFRISFILMFIDFVLNNPDKINGKDYDVICSNWEKIFLECWEYIRPYHDSFETIKFEDYIKHRESIYYNQYFVNHDLTKINQFSGDIKNLRNSFESLQNKLRDIILYYKYPEKIDFDNILECIK